jgi:alpha-tubulin suppressor-like RCC1 family protein
MGNHTQKRLHGEQTCNFVHFFLHFISNRIHPGGGTNAYTTTITAYDTKGCDVVDTATSYTVILLLCSDGAVYVQGTNLYMGLGLGNTDLGAYASSLTRINHEEKFKKVYCGVFHCIIHASTNYQVAYSWGRNE